MIRFKLTSVIVADQAKAREIYVGILGFQVKTDIPIGPINWLTVVSPADPNGVELALDASAVAPEVTAYQAWRKSRGIPCAAFAVEDLDAEHERLTEAGLVFTSAPGVMGPTRACAFDDQCGNLVLLYQDPDHG